MDYIVLIEFSTGWLLLCLLVSAWVHLGSVECEEELP